jgi:hypothetical protein
MENYEDLPLEILREVGTFASVDNYLIKAIQHLN